MIVRYDARTLGQLLSDNNTELTPSEVQSSTKLEAILLAASGRLELATFAGQRYTAADLHSFPDPSGQREVLIDLVCTFAMSALMQRRPHIIVKLGQQWEENLNLINQLRQGERIFGFTEAADAGKNVERVHQHCTISDQAHSWLGGCCGGCCYPGQNCGEDAFGTLGGCGCC